MDAATREAIAELRARGALNDKKLTAKEAAAYLFSKEGFAGASQAYATDAGFVASLSQIPDNVSLQPGLDRNASMAQGVQRIMGGLGAALREQGVEVVGSRDEWFNEIVNAAKTSGFLKTAVAAR